MTRADLKNIIRETIVENSEYQDFVQKVMNKFGTDSIADMSDEKKKAFFNFLDKKWNAGKGETDIDEVNVNERSYNRAGGDPRWIKSKYAGKDSNGKSFKKGEEVLYFPNGRKIFTGKEADKAWRDFESNASDEDWMGGQFREGLDEIVVSEESSTKISVGSRYGNVDKDGHGQNIWVKSQRKDGKYNVVTKFASSGKTFKNIYSKDQLEKKIADLDESTNLNEGDFIGHVKKVGQDLFVDSNFLNLTQGILPNVELKHAGGGDFYIKTSAGTIQFNRTNEKIAGFVGRAHRVTDRTGGQILTQLLKGMFRANKIEKLVKAENTTNDALSEGPIARATTALLKYVEKTPEHLTDLIKFNKDFRGIHFKDIMKSAENLNKAGKVKYDGDMISLSESTLNEAPQLNGVNVPDSILSTGSKINKMLISRKLPHTFSYDKVNVGARKMKDNGSEKFLYYAVIRPLLGKGRDEIESAIGKITKQYRWDKSSETFRVSLGSAVDESTKLNEVNVATIPDSNGLRVWHDPKNGDWGYNSATGKKRKRFTGANAKNKLHKELLTVLKIPSNLITRTFTAMNESTLNEGQKMISINPAIGSSKHSINVYDGKSTHKDGSPFIGIDIVKTKAELQAKLKDYQSKGYKVVSSVFNQLHESKTPVNEATFTLDRAVEEAVGLNDYALKRWVDWLTGRLADANKPDSNTAHMKSTLETRLKGALKVQSDRAKASSQLSKKMNESLNEVSVSQVQTTIDRTKQSLKHKWIRTGGYENFGQTELRKLRSKFKDNPYGSPDERTISKMLSAFNDWAMNYDGGPLSESTKLNEGDGPEGMDMVVDALRYALKASGDNVHTTRVKPQGSDSFDVEVGLRNADDEEFSFSIENGIAKIHDHSGSDVLGKLNKHVLQRAFVQRFRTRSESVMEAFDSSDKREIQNIANEIVKKVYNKYPEATGVQLINTLRTVLMTIGLGRSNPNYSKIKPFLPAKFNSGLFDADGGNHYDSAWSREKDAVKDTILKRAVKSLNMKNESVMEASGDDGTVELVANMRDIVKTKTHQYGVVDDVYAKDDNRTQYKIRILTNPLDNDSYTKGKSYLLRSDEFWTEMKKGQFKRELSKLKESTLKEASFRGDRFGQLKVGDIFIPWVAEKGPKKMIAVFKKISNDTAEWRVGSKSGKSKLPSDMPTVKAELDDFNAGKVN
jgi:hypothetical protein